MPERIYSALLILLVFVFISCNPPDEEVVYDYSLVDINPNSDTYGINISPDYFENQVTVHYFGHQGWGLCQTRVGNLDNLYTNLLDSLITNVKIIAIGKSAESSSNTEWTNDNKIPILVDPSPNTTWSNWGAKQRDLFFLDSNGNYVTDFNISNWDYNKVYSQIKDILPE